MNKKILYPVLVLALGLGVATLIATNKPAWIPPCTSPWREPYASPKFGPSLST